MITFWQQENGKFIHKEQEELDKNSSLWVDARNVNREDMRILEEDFHIQQEHILDILDQDELSRIEKEDDYLLIIVRLPVFVPDADVSYFTIPLGIILYENMFITICWTDCEVLKDISSNRLKGLNLSDFPALLTRILSRADTIFLRYLKEINRRSTTIQNELQLSIKNIELIQLSNLEKSLVYFSTSLKANEVTLEKMLKLEIMQKYELPAGTIQIEITETVGDMDHMLIRDVANSLRMMGFVLAMDDFDSMEAPDVLDMDDDYIVDFDDIDGLDSSIDAIDDDYGDQ